MKKYMLIIIPMFFLIGCATPAHKLELTALKFESSANYEESIQGPNNRTERRQEQLLQLIENYDKTLTKAEEKLKTLAKQADKRSSATLGISAAGIASGITAGVLLVASPANAVWAAAFTGFGTGVLSFQTRMFEEGYSRQTIARLHDDTMKSMAAANEQYETNLRLLVIGITCLETDEWNEHLALAFGAIIKMNAATIFMPLPIGTPDDNDDLKKSNAELKKLIEDLNANVSKIEPEQP